jgi:pyruvate/2-oxoglutarate dehydrogenase complex dihydrolipoamide acyltransferase (E2) component
MYPARAGGEGTDMRMHQSAFDVVPLTPFQHQMVDWLGLMHRQHTMHGLIEVDITETRRAIHAYRARTGAPLSLTTFLVACLARAVGEDRAVHAYRLGPRRLVLFADVDVAIMVERDLHGAKVPVPHIIRAANKKGLGQIQQEIRTAQMERPEAIAGASLPRWLQPALGRGLTVWLVLPAAIRRLILAWIVRNPHRRKRLTGTVGLSAVGMFGRGAGWGIAPNAYTLSLVVGGIARRPRAGEEHSKVHDYLCLTVSFDHDVIDGAPAARFIRRLTGLIEDGIGLRDQQAASCAARTGQLPAHR